jgi:hypothetical protein
MIWVQVINFCIKNLSIFLLILILIRSKIITSIAPLLQSKTIVNDLFTNLGKH